MFLNLRSMVSIRYLAPSPRSGRQRCRPFHGLDARFVGLTWGLRPRFYAVVRFADYSSFLNLRRALWSCDLEFPTEQPKIVAISSWL